MTEVQASTGATLLARKGHAVPLGAVGADTAPAQAPAVPSEAKETSQEPIGTPPETPSGTAAPVSSLLPLDFLTRRQDSLDLALLSQERSEVTAAPAVEAIPETPMPSGEPKTPRAVPTLRIDAGAKPASQPEPRRFPVLAVGLVVALLLAAAAYGYQSKWFTRPAPRQAVTEAPTETPIEPSASKSLEASPEASTEASTDVSTGTSLAASPEAASASGADADRSSEPEPSSEAIRPSVDVVRIEPDGAAVIAGRAAPGAELILLDNGAPIGTTQADSFGEWVFIPIDPLPSGAHDFGLVLKNIQGGVSVPPLEKMPSSEDDPTPGVSSPNEPGTARGAAAVVPIPPRKPDTGAPRPTSVSFPAFVVQLAAVKSRGAAEREWQALQQRFPAILSALSLNLDETKLAGGDTVVRLRTGAFRRRAEAAAICERLTAKDQDCLVVRTTGRR